MHATTRMHGEGLAVRPAVSRASRTRGPYMPPFPWSLPSAAVPQPTLAGPCTSVPQRRRGAVHVCDDHQPAAQQDGGRGELTGRCAHAGCPYQHRCTQTLLVRAPGGQRRIAHPAAHPSPALCRPACRLLPPQDSQPGVVALPLMQHSQPPACPGTPPKVSRRPPTLSPPAHAGAQDFHLSL